MRAVLLALIIALLVLAACAVPEPSSKTINFAEQRGVKATEALADAGVPEPVVAQETVVRASGPVVSTADAEQVLREFAVQYQAFNGSGMYPYLHKALRDSMTPEQLDDVLVFFRPEAKRPVRFVEIKDSVGVLEQGSKDSGWRPINIPLVQEENDWHLVMFDNLTTTAGIVNECNLRISLVNASFVQALNAAKLSASNCIANAAKALHDKSLCPYAVMDRQRCFNNLGISLSIDAWIGVCKNTEVDIELTNTTISTCLGDVGVQQKNVKACRAIETNRAERYFCLGEVGGLLEEPWQCNDAINDYTLRLCLEKYLEKTHDKDVVCNNPNWSRIVPDC